MPEFEIILTFNDLPQEIINLNISCDNETVFLEQIYKHIGNEKKNKLIKISSCMLYCESFNDLPLFIQKNRGKFYF